MLKMLYESEVGCAILFAVVCWGSRLRVTDVNRLKLVCKARDFVGVETNSLALVSERRMERRRTMSATHSIMCWSNTGLQSVQGSFH